MSDDFPLTRLSANEAKEIIALIDDDWRRSTIYQILGAGITRDGRIRKPKWEGAYKNKELAEQIRRLIDSCYYRAINHDLRVPARFPGRTLPSSLDLMYPGSEKTEPFPLGIQPQEPGSLALREEMLSRSAVCIKGDVSGLFSEFGKLSIHQIWQLRQEDTCFRDYYELHTIFLADQTKNVWTDTSFAQEMSARAFDCLQAIGEKCCMRIERTTSSKVRLVMKSSLLASNLLVTGIAISIGDEALKGLLPLPWLLAMGVSIGVHTAFDRAGSKILPGAADWIIHLSSRLQRVSPSNPVIATVHCLGDIKTPDLD